jgi:hypothetical protein
MSKIYIENYNPNDLTNKLVKLKPLLKSKTETKHLYCNDGMYVLENNKLFQLEPNFMSKIETKKVGKINFVIDSTLVNKVEVQSQMPLSYIIRATTLNVYGGQGSRDTTLNVEMIGDNVVGFYFLCKEVDFGNPFFREDLETFLSVLF